MRNFREPTITRCIELIIIISSMFAILFMITGGCGGDGGQGNPPGPTGPPPGCEDTYIDPDCPADSISGLCSFWGYSCDFTEQNPETPEPQTFSIGLNPTRCISQDCFTLECDTNTDESVSELSTITLNISELEKISDIVPYAFIGTSEIDGVQFEYICNPPTAIP